MEVRDFMPMMTDVVSGGVPSPVELPDGLPADSYVATADGDVYWPGVSPAWRGLGLGSAADVCIAARRGRSPYPLCERIQGQVNELRDLLGEQGPAICARGQVIVFNADGTRAAYTGSN